MNTETVSKSPERNRLEGFALTAIFQAVPGFSIAVLGLKLLGNQQVVAHPGIAAIYVVVASAFQAMMMPWFARKFPKFVRQGYEPLFYDGRLSVSEKLARWRAQPQTSWGLMMTMVVLSVLSVAVVGLG